MNIIITYHNILFDKKNMCKESQYLVEQFRNVLEYYEEKHKLSDLYFIFKNFYEVTDNDGET